MDHTPISQSNQEPISDTLPEARPVLTARCPQRKCTDEQWACIRSMIEAGAAAPDVAKSYGLAPATINTKAHKECWATPRRVAAALASNDQNVDDPAALVAAIWAKRKEDARESLFQGASKSLSRFFALAPVPQTFSEAAIAEKLLSKAIDPDASSAAQSNVSIQLLATQGFQPRRTIDV